MSTFEVYLDACSSHLHLGLLGFFYRQDACVVAFLTGSAFDQGNQLFFLGFLESRLERFGTAFELGEEVDFAVKDDVELCARRFFLEDDFVRRDEPGDRRLLVVAALEQFFEVLVAMLETELLEEGLLACFGALTHRHHEDDFNLAFVPVLRVLLQRRHQRLLEDRTVGALDARLASVDVHAKRSGSQASAMSLHIKYNW